MKKESAEAGHAKFGASSSERWMNCPGSISLTEQAPPGKTSAYAEEGTRAHGCLETILKNYISGGKPYSAAHALKQTHGEEMVRHALDAFKWVEARHQTCPDAQVLSETKVPLPVSVPDQFGTVDAAIVELFGRLTVIDFKYGAGIPVDPKNNSQLIYYALGLAHLYDYNFEDVEIVIIQPRAEVEGGPVRSWITTTETLVEWREKFEQAIETAVTETTKYAAGKWCRFCPAATICPELSTRALKQAQIDFDPADGALALPIPGVKGLQIPNLEKILNASDRIEEWIGKIRDHACHVLERGEKIPGWKLVAKRSTRKWVDREKVEKEVRKQWAAIGFSEPELLSPAQFEKQIGAYENKEFAAKFVADRTTSLSSGTTLVSDEDPRPAVNLIEQDFETINPEEGGNERGNKKESGKEKESRKKSKKVIYK